jgi:hypothetical protein
LCRWEDAEQLAGEAIHAARENDLPIVLELARALRTEVQARVPGIPLASPEERRTQYLETLRNEAFRTLLRWRPRKPD